MIFARTDCPISNRYAPTIAKLQRDFAPRGVKIRLVYPEPGATLKSINEHQLAYGLQSIPAALDAKLERVRQAGVHVTPEAVVLAEDGRVVYRGRIDDRQASLRVARTPQKRDLEEAIEDALAGRLPGLRATKAVGCAIEAIR